MRRAAKRDISEPEVIETLERLGWSVEQLSGKGTPDLLIGRGHHLCLIEAKTGKRKLNEHQIKWHSAWKGPKPLIFRDATDVLNFHNSLLRQAKV